MTRRYSLGPLLEHTGWTMQRVRSIAPCGGPEYRRRYAEGVTEALADRLATAAGLHPALVWDDWLDGAMRRCDRCGTRFVPVRRKQRWCSRRCRDHNAQVVYQRRRWQRDPEWAETQRERNRRYRREVAELEAKRRQQREGAV